MANNVIRIQCNPYTKEIKYYWKNDGGSELWSDLSESKSSPFARSKTSYKGFAEATVAHKVYEILSVINTQYNKSNSGIEIIVDGTKDDVEEFDNVIKTSFADSGMVCSAGDLYMLSAKEVMPQIEGIYSSLAGILKDHSDDEIGGLIARYSDTVKPDIALCVMGLYSSGKSSFINSLIGKEILPSASDPATAKIYKISCEDSVWVGFEYEGAQYKIEFLDDEWKINTSPDADLVSNVVDAVNKVKGKEKQLYTALSTLNEFAIAEGKTRQNKLEKLASEEGVLLDEFLDKHSIKTLIENNQIDEYKLADLIELGVPFADNTLLPINEFNFVIFDTPGSNSEMHKEHVEILKKSLEDRTNGLPIFVTNATTLDNTDNVPIINMIETMGESLDGTSTMIVVNKADENPKKALMQKREKIGELKVTSWKPSRIYFVSSIIALGQKIDDPILQESWNDQEYADIYYDNYKKFDGSDDRSLLQLYKYNIVPQNAQDEVTEIVEQCDDDELILWNTGIRSIEREIGAFGERFALYNKCVQAEKYLEEAIVKLTEKIEHTTEEIEKTQGQIEDSIEDAIKDLVDKMRVKCADKKSELDTSFSSDVVGVHVERYIDSNRIRGLISSAIDEAKRDSYKWKQSGIFKSAENSTEYVKYVKKTVSKKFDDDVKAYAKAVSDASANFWNQGINELKSLLLQVVYDSPKLTDEQKVIAKDIVMQAGKMQNTHSELDLGVGAGTERKSFLWIKWDEFNSYEAEKAYYSSLKNVIEGKNKSYKLENTQAFEKWKVRLVDLLKAKLSQLNPTVIELNKSLVHYQVLGDELNEQLKAIEKARFDIIQLLSFKEA